ncbi:MAG: hypothetical protein AB1414_09765 [bacterium]
MSGYKRSSITYDPRVNLLFAIRNQKTKAVNKINLLKSQVERLFQRIEKEKSSAKIEATISCLNQYMETVKSRQTDIEEITGFLPELPESPTSVALNTLQDMDKVISNTETKSNRIESELETVNRQIYELKSVDKDIVEVELELEKISNLLKENDTTLQRWETQEHKDLNEQKEELTKHLFDYKEALKQKEVVSTQILKELLMQTRELIDKIEATALESTEKDKLQEKRLYFVNSLKEVFKELGFRIKTELAYEKEGDLNSRITIVFHSAYYGDVDFYIPLKGEIASDSKISLENCEVEYKKVSRLLKERFGLNSEFKRELQTGKPEDKYETAIPQPEVLKTMERG